METITKYKAYNGSEFNDQEGCLNYEIQCKAADRIIEQLDSKPDSCDFSNGGGYIQHEEDLFKKVKRELLELANEQAPHKWLDQTLNEDDAHPSWAYRWISDCCNLNLANAWLRVYCTDKNYREWGQVYYAEHPNKAEQIQIN